MSQPETIGSKLKNSPPSLSDEITEASEDPKYAEAKEIIRKLKSDTAALEQSRKEYFMATRPELIK